MYLAQLSKKKGGLAEISSRMNSYEVISLQMTLTI